MKNIFKSLSALIAVACLLACGGAQAAPLSYNFVADSGQVFQTKNVLSVEKAPGYVKVRQMSGTVQSFPDATGAVFNKVLNSPSFAASFVQVPGTTRYVNTTVVTEVLCYSGTQTAIGYPSPVQAEFFNDGCQLHAVVKASSN